jgi:hypothetical protein
LADMQAGRARFLIDGNPGSGIDGPVHQHQRPINRPASKDPIERQMWQQ